MKLFKFVNNHEGMGYENNIFLTLGRKIEGNGVLNGFYVRLQSPFASWQVLKNAQTLEPEYVLCSKTYLWSARKTKGQTRRTHVLIGLYIPVK